MWKKKKSDMHLIKTLEPKDHGKIMFTNWWKKMTKECLKIEKYDSNSVYKGKVEERDYGKRTQYQERRLGGFV